MLTLPVTVGSSVTSPARGTTLERVLASSGTGLGCPLVAVLAAGASRYLLGHLESGPTGALWVVAPLDDAALSGLAGLDLSDWEDVGWDDAYDLLDPDLSVTLVAASLDGVVQDAADVSPRPAELEALLDAAVDVFGGGGCCGGGCDQ